MNRTEKRVLWRTLQLGLLLTLLTIVADWLGVISPLERYIYDLRARLCQFSSPPPTDQLVHLDIGDASLKEIGWWPWPRAKLAEMLDEISLAGAKVIAMDVLFPEPQETRYEKQPDGSFTAIEDDQIFAASARRAGNLLIPITAQFNRIDQPSDSVERLKEFAQPLPENAPPLLRADSELATILPLAQAIRYSAVINFIPDSDGIVRVVPLFINYRGKLMPHMALAAFCAEMNVPMDQVKLSPESVTIPIPGGAPIIVPVRTIHSKNLGNVGAFMNIPWIGSGRDAWLTMYDWPKHQQVRQHYPLSDVWVIRQKVRSIAKNNRQADMALAVANVLVASSETAAFLANPKDETRNTVIQKTLQELTELGIGALEKEKPQELKVEEQELLGAFRALRDTRTENLKLHDELRIARSQLHDELKGRYVVIGWTATGTGDAYPTSVEPLVPGVAMQGTVFNALATREFWRSTPWIVGALLTFIVGSLTTAAVSLMPTWRAMGTTLIIILGFLALNGIVLFDYGNLVVPAGPIIATMLISFGVTSARYIYERRERSRITRRFGSYVDPALVNYVIENPDSARFDGQIREMTVVFTDLAGFTTISEKLQEKTVPLLNEYMSLMLPIIRQNRGYWNKFLGDGIMFFFNAPADNLRHANDAVYTALKMQRAMAPFNQGLLARGLPQVAMRAGIATGMMVVGDAGSTDPSHYASDYTVLGDEVNLGARLESANKAFGSRILLNERAFELLGPEILVRPMGKLQVMGKTEGIMTYEAICLGNDATPHEHLIADLSTQIVDSFRHSQFEQCQEVARKLETECGSTKFTQLYIHLSRQYLAEPPGNGFDGQIVLESK